MHWLEISLTVPGELAEAIAEVLARFTPQGVVIESTYIAPDPGGEGYPEGPLRVCGYLPVDADLEATRQRLEEALWYLGRISPLPQPIFREIEEVNWVQTWKEHYRPIPIGKHLLILPAWYPSPDPERISIKIEPGMAFGTGTHPTTQMCLEAAEDYTLPGKPVIDVGCGSGILAVAALKLGANRALGVDIESEALQAAQQNASLNGVANQFELGLGSIREILAGAFSLQKAPLVFANILAPILVRLLTEGLGQLIDAQGVAVLSGILAEQEQEVLQAAQSQGLHLHKRYQIDDWVALVFETAI